MTKIPHKLFAPSPVFLLFVLLLAISSLTFSSSAVTKSSSSLIPQDGRIKQGNENAKIVKYSTLLKKHMRDDCDLENDGAAACASSRQSYKILRAYEAQRHLSTMGLLFVVVVLLIVIQWLIRIVTEGVAKSKDRHLRLYEETTFRQVAIVLLVCAILQMAVQSHTLGGAIEKWFFSGVSNMFSASMLNINHSAIILDQLLVICLIFAATFLVFASYAAICAFFLQRWLRKCDAMDVQNAVLRDGRGSKAVRQFLVFRCEFEESLQQSSVPGLDPPGLYFQKYLRAAGYHTITRILSVHPTTLLLALGFCLVLTATPIVSVARASEVITIICMSSFFLVVTILLLVRMHFIKKQLLPSDVNTYLKYHISSQDSLRSQPNYSYHGDVVPAYRTGKTSRETCLPAQVAAFLYGSRHPSSHEALFFFWRRGPGVLIHLTEICTFAQLVILAVTFTVMEDHATTWLELYWPWGVLGVFLVSLVQWLLLPTVLWNLTIVTSTGGLINDGILQEVWETQRARTVHRFRTLLDCARMEANLFVIEQGGQELRTEMVNRAICEPVYALQADDLTFKRLDVDGDGRLTTVDLHRYLLQQGLPIGSEDAAGRWIRAFDRTQRGSLSREDFAVLAWNVRMLMTSELNVDSVVALFQEKYNLPLQSIVDVNTLLNIFTSWNLRWSRLHILHLLQYLSGMRGMTSMTTEQFLFSLRTLESHTIRTLQHAAVELRSQDTTKSSRTGLPSFGVKSNIGSSGSLLRTFSKAHTHLGKKDL